MPLISANGYEALIRGHSRYSRWDSSDAKLLGKFFGKMKHAFFLYLYLSLCLSFVFLCGLCDFAVGAFYLVEALFIYCLDWLRLLLLDCLNYPNRILDT
jgi:hypothetical protein